MYRLAGQIIAALTFAPVVFTLLVVGVALALSCNEVGVISQCSNPNVVAPLVFLFFWIDQIGILVLGYGVICLLTWFLIGALRGFRSESSEGHAFELRFIALVLLVALMAAETYTICNSGSKFLSVAYLLALYLGPLVLVAEALVRKSTVLPVVSAVLAIIVGSLVGYEYHTSHDPSRGLVTFISLFAYWISGLLAGIALLQSSPNPPSLPTASQSNGSA